MPHPEYLTGAELIFEGGSLNLDFRKKRGHFAFTDDQIEPIREVDEDGVWDGYLVKLPNSELEAIRDFLTEWLGAPGWQPIETAPTEPDDGYVRCILIAAVKQDGRQIVGEAYWLKDSGRGAWWWANTGPHNYNDEPIEMNWVPTLWMPLPEAPVDKRGG